MIIIGVLEVNTKILLRLPLLDSLSLNKTTLLQNTAELYEH